MPTAEGNIYDRLSVIQPFHPFSAELLPEDWSIEPGDVVKIKSDDGEYNVPIYSTGINWSGASVVSLSTTGNQERKPLPELKRKEFEQSRSTYGNSMAIKKAEEEIESHWKHVTQVTDQGMSDAFGVIGVKIGADGKPVKDSSGHYVWNDSGAGGEIWGHMNRTAWDTQIVHHIKDENGKIISLGEVYTDAYGNVIINAINDQRTGTATINANRIALNASGTITLNTKFGLNSAGSLLIYGKTITDNDLLVGRNISISEGYAITFSGPNDDTDYYPCMAIFGNYAAARQILAHEDLKVGLEAVTNGGQIEIKFANNSSMNKNSASFSIDAISAVAEDEDPPDGKIGFTYTKLDGTTGTVNFNIAATQCYIDGVAARTADRISGISLSDYNKSTGNATASVTVGSADGTSVQLSSDVSASGIYYSGGNAVSNTIRFLVWDKDTSEFRDVTPGERVSIGNLSWQTVRVEFTNVYGSNFQWGIEIEK